MFTISDALPSTPPHSKQRLIVKFSKNKVPKELADKKDLIYRKLFPKVYSVSGKTVFEMTEILKKNKNVVYFEKDFKGSKHKFKNIIPIYPQSNFSEPGPSSFFKDPMAKKQWHLHSAKKYGSSIDTAIS